MTAYKDRAGRALAIGQYIRVQECVGRYGQTAIREGEIVELSRYGGATIKTAFEFHEDCGRFGVHYRAAGSLVTVSFPFDGYERFDDFEHGHERWVEIIDAIPGRDSSPNKK